MNDLIKRIRYEPETGQLFWVEPRCSRHKVGSPVGGRAKNGYVYLTNGSKKILAHRFIWLYMTGQEPAGQIDHVNRDRSGNRWYNLRLADRSQQKGNARNHPTRGIEQIGSRFYPRIKLDYRHVRLGAYATLEEAQAAYDEAARAAWGEHYNGMRQR